MLVTPRLTVPQGETLKHTLNATDDFDTYEQLEFIIASQPKHGMLELDGRTFTYTPRDAFFGVERFNFTVNPNQPLACNSGSWCLSVSHWRDSLSHSDIGWPFLRNLQVRDGMLMEASGVIEVEVLHVNADPRSACSASAGLVSSALGNQLRGLVDPALPSAANSTGILDQLEAEYSIALAEDSLLELPRTLSLGRMIENAESERIISGTKSYNLICSPSVAFDLQMGTRQEPSNIGFALLGYDPDEQGELTYELTQSSGEAGVAYATTAMPGQPVSQVPEPGGRSLPDGS